MFFNNLRQPWMDHSIGNFLVIHILVSFLFLVLWVSLFTTPFGHFQFQGSAGQNPKLILTLCHKENDGKNEYYYNDHANFDDNDDKSPRIQKP